MSLIPALQQIVSGNADDPSRDMSNWNNIVSVVNGQLGDSNINASEPITVAKTTLGTFTSWTSFTPSWTSATSSPTVGNATLTCRYTQIGKVVIANYYLLWGSTTSAGGTGAWYFSLPVAQNTSQQLFNGSAVAISAIGNYTSGTANPQSATTIGIMGTWGEGSPFSWSTGAILRITITYEAN